MRIGDIVYFSSNKRIVDINFNNKEEIKEIFFDRINDFYLKPAIKLNESKDGFAAGVLLLTMIDALARYLIKNPNSIGDRIKSFIHKYIDNNENFKKTMYDNFRNGLVHEARIKNCCMFSYDYNQLYYDDSPVFIVNPKILQEVLSEALVRIKKELIEDNSLMNDFVDQLKLDFQDEINKLINS